MPRKSTKRFPNVPAGRNWTCLVYADSAPENWESILAEMMIPAFISPYHDQDINPTGEPKKPHWHVMVLFEGNKSADQIADIFDKIGGVYNPKLGPERVESVRGMARYLCHMDNPEKVRYDASHVRCFAGADYATACNLEIDRYKTVREIIQYARKNKIRSMKRLMNVCVDQYPEWFRVLVTGSAYVVQLYLTSDMKGEEKDADNAEDNG